MSEGLKLSVFIGGILLEVIGGMLFRLVSVVSESINSPPGSNGAKVVMGSLLEGFVSILHYGGIALFTFGFALTIYGAVAESQRRR